MELSGAVFGKDTLPTRPILVDYGDYHTLLIKHKSHSRYSLGQSTNAMPSASQDPSPNPYAAEDEKQTQRSLVCSLECVWAELEPWSDLKAEDSATLGPPLCPRSLGCPPPPKGRQGALRPLGKEVPVAPWGRRSLSAGDSAGGES